jgi:formylglycine-generating enzyme required for sulfatase activity
MKKTIKLIAIVAAIAFPMAALTSCGDGAGGNTTGTGGNGSTPGTSGLVAMVQIPGGTFTMGSPTTEPNRQPFETQHTVTLTGFSMGKYPVTQEEYQKVMGSNPSNFKAAVSGESGTPGKLPVETVSWYDALVFCNKLSISEGLSPAYSIDGKTNPAEWGTVPTSSDAAWNTVAIVNGSNGYRLPTEAQWEYACRAGTTTAYNTGATISDNTGWYNANSGDKTHQVGKKQANSYGLYDMHGNVYEWCWDWYDDYASGAQTNPTGPTSGTSRVRRGGSWGNPAEALRSAYRVYFDPHNRYVYIGFRLLRP